MCDCGQSLCKECKEFEDKCKYFTIGFTTCAFLVGIVIYMSDPVQMITKAVTKQLNKM